MGVVVDLGKSAVGIAMGVKINAQEKPDSEYVQAVKQMSLIIFKRFFSILKEYPWTVRLSVITV